MGFLKKLKNFTVAATSAWGGGYDASKTTNRRRAPASSLMSEDEMLDRNDRRVVVGSARDLRRNFAAARWALNKHLDFVVSHNFKSKSGDRDFDRRLERFVEYLSRKENFDVTGRHHRRRYFRMMEASRLIDGDMLNVRLLLDDKGYMQPVEGDRLRDPPYSKLRPGERWVQGLRVGRRGEVLEYAVHSRRRESFDFERRVRADKARLFGYFDRFDQYRGISPMASAINTYAGLYEGLDYALAKAKVAQLFALAIFRDAEDGFNFDDGADDNTVAAADRGTYEVDFSKGPQFLDLDPGDRAEFLESETPGAATQEFWKNMIGLALKSCDIPYSFWDEAHTNFFGSKSALILYQKSAKEKQYDIREELNAWLVWQLMLAEITGEFDFPVGYDPTQELWAWVPDGVPWWDLGKEISANKLAVDATFKTRSEVRAEAYGDDWYDVVDRLKEEQQYLIDAGIVHSPPEGVVDQGQFDEEDDAEDSE